MTELIALAEQLRWEAANLRARPLWLIEPETLIAVATRIDAVADAIFAAFEKGVAEAAE